MYLIFAIGAFQSFVFTLLLLFKRESKTADKFLAGFFFVIMLYLLNIYSTNFDLWINHPNILFIYTLVFLSYGPLLYFYVSSLIGRNITVRQILRHLVPIILVLLIILPFAFEDKETKLLCFTDRFKNLPLYISVGTFLQYLSSPIYFVWIFIILKKHNKYVHDHYSYDEKINLQWMNKLLIGGISIWLIECINVILLNFTEWSFPYDYNSSWYIKISFIVFVMIIGVYGINQGGIFSKTNKVYSLTPKYKSSEDKEKLIVKNSTNKKTTLKSSNLSEKHKQELIAYIENEKVYLNNELRIQDLSIELKIPVHILSHIINTELNQNFFDFINAYRIEEVKKRLHNPEYDHLTIIAIAFDCGFNSKATFNRLFKLHTQQTPSQYKKSLI